MTTKAIGIGYEAAKDVDIDLLRVMHEGSMWRVWSIDAAIVELWRPKIRVKLDVREVLFQIIVYKKNK